MPCPHCCSAKTTERSDRTAHGYRRFRCRGCGRGFNERTGSVLNRLQLPTDVVFLIVLWRLRMKLSLRDLAEILLLRGLVFSHEAIRDWVSSVEHTAYCFGTAAGPHPFPAMVRDFCRSIGDEAREQTLELTGALPDAVLQRLSA